MRCLIAKISALVIAVLPTAVMASWQVTESQSTSATNSAFNAGYQPAQTSPVLKTKVTQENTAVPASPYFQTGTQKVVSTSSVKNTIETSTNSSAANTASSSNSSEEVAASGVTTPDQMNTKKTITTTTALSTSYKTPNIETPDYKQSVSHHSVTSYTEKPTVYAISVSGSLKENITRIMRRYNWKVIWKAPYDFNFDGKITGTSLPDVMQKLLHPFPLQAVMYMSNRTMAVVPREM